MATTAGPLGDVPRIVLANDPALLAPAQKIENSFQIQTGDPFVIDYDPKVLPEDQWIIEGVSALFDVAAAPAILAPGPPIIYADSWKPPVSGLYLCPQGTDTETTDLARGDMNFRSRPVPIPLDPYTEFRSIPSASAGAFTVGAIQFVGQSGFRVTVPGGWFIRALLVLNPGVAAPNDVGPGAGSFGKLTAVVRVIRKTDVARQILLDVGQG